MGGFLSVNDKSDTCPSNGGYTVSNQILDSISCTIYSFAQ